MVFFVNRYNGSVLLGFFHLLIYTFNALFLVIVYYAESKAQSWRGDDGGVPFLASFSQKRIAPNFDYYYDYSLDNGFVHYLLFNYLLNRQENSPVVHLRIPQSYLRGGGGAVIQAWQASLLVKYLKDEKAILPDDKSLFLCMGPCVERMTLIISNRSGMGNEFNIKNVIFKNLLEEAKNISEDLIFSSEEINGLTVYRKRYNSRNADIIAQDFYVERAESGEIGFIANCFPNGKNPLCQGYTESPPGSGVTVRYSFSMSHIHNYRNISDAIDKTVASWLVEILPPSSSKGSSSGR